MKIKKNNLNYVNVLSYACLFFLFLCFSHIEKQVMPYSVAIFSTALAMGCSLIVTPILFLLNFLVLGKTNMLLPMLICAVFFTFVTLVYRKIKTRSGLIFSAFTAISLVAYVLMVDSATPITLEKKLICSLFTVLLSYLCYVSANAVINKGISLRLGYDEYACIIAVIIVLGLGICNFLSPYAWKAVCALIVIGVCYLLNFGIGCIISSILGISLAIYYGNVTMVSIFLLWGIFCGALMPVNKYAASLSVPFCDLIVQLVFPAYGTYGLADFLPILVSSLLFCIIPSKALRRLKDKLHYFKEKQLVRQTINRNKTMLSNRLYELSGVFSDIKATFKAFNENEINADHAKNLIFCQTTKSVCDKCEKNAICIKNKKDKTEGLSKMIDIGFAKGRLTLIDMPKSLGNVCARPSELLYYVNKLLADYRTYCLDKKNACIGRDLLADEAEGVSEILKSLALESGALLSFQYKQEKLLSENLQKKGYVVNELLIYGESENLTVSMIITMKEFSLPALQSVISKTVGANMILCDKNDITEGKVYLVFKRQAPFDAVFGIAGTTKEGSEKSGDTHSVVKLADDKFLIALSDGMGSGKKAEKVSSTALSLIESFYKAGLKANLILSTVNKLLSINAEDNFTALDVSVIDLKTCQADFIKYGSPYGFIIGENGIKIVEGNSLPLGILEELKPSVCHTDLKNDNMILLVTDGVSDAFGSSGEIIDFIRTMPALNPQSLADSIVKKAIELNDGKPNDDMTALAVRIYKKNAV